MLGTPCAAGNRVEARRFRIADDTVVNTPPAAAVSAVAPAAAVAAERGTAQTSCFATPSLLPECFPAHAGGVWHALGHGRGERRRPRCRLCGR